MCTIVLKKNIRKRKQYDSHGGQFAMSPLDVTAAGKLEVQPDNSTRSDAIIQLARVKSEKKQHASYSFKLRTIHCGKKE